MPSSAAPSLVPSPRHLGRRHLLLVPLTGSERRGTSPSSAAPGLVSSPRHLGRRRLLLASLTGSKRKGRRSISRSRRPASCRRPGRHRLLRRHCVFNISFSSPRLAHPEWSFPHRTPPGASDSLLASREGCACHTFIMVWIHATEPLGAYPSSLRTCPAHQGLAKWRHGTARQSRQGL